MYQVTPSLHPRVSPAFAADVYHTNNFFQMKEFNIHASSKTKYKTWLSR